MFEAMGVEASELALAIAPMRTYFEQYLPSGVFRVWVAEHHSVPIAAIGLVIHSVPPSPRNPIGKVAYIMNLVTLPEHRRLGIAKRLLSHVLDIIQSEGILKVSLHASCEGKPLYEQLGFKTSADTPEMWLTLEQ
jgi:ribosomal protein S18 acetylase RimI-like enzyme